jgi:hypothetical protein
MMRPLVLLLTLLIVACNGCVSSPPSPGPVSPPTPAPAPSVDPTPVATTDATPTAPDGARWSACPASCAKMKSFRCPEGLDLLCSAKCRQAELDGLVRTHPDCVARAKSAAQARLCSSSINCAGVP